VFSKSPRRFAIRAGFGCFRSTDAYTFAPAAPNVNRKMDPFRSRIVTRKRDHFVTIRELTPYLQSRYT
jgi:hypothetical protein